MSAITQVQPRVAASTFRDVLGVGEFRALLGAQVLSRVGDQLAAVALAVLVYERTSSAFYTAATYSVTFLPWLVGGPLLSGLADRLPRRRVMVSCDVARAVLVAAMASLELPLLVLFALLFLVALLESPFTAARAATVPDVLAGERYVLGCSLVTLTNELAQVGGFAAGGALVALVGARGSLGLDAGTYAVSALLLLRLHRRPAASASVDPLLSLRGFTAAARLLWGSPELRRLTALAWLCAFYVVPEALAVPYAHAGGAGAGAAGLLLAANPAGTALGSLWLSRFADPELRTRLTRPLAVLSCAALIPVFLSPPWWAAGLLFAVSGVGSAYNLPANAAFVVAVPAAQRGQAFGLVVAGMAVGQGVALLAAGAAAGYVPLGAVIGGAGALGAAVAYAFRGLE